MKTMSGFLSFAVCFAVLFNIWNSQNIFFRRFGLNDSITVALNAFLLFVVLLYVYPLKFLFRLVFNDNVFQSGGSTHEMISTAQTSTLMVIYGAGYTTINLVFFLLYLNAKKYRDMLQLNAAELYETDTIIIINLITTIIGVIAIILALALPGDLAGYSGFFYFSIGIAYYFWYKYRHRHSEGFSHN